MGSLSKILAAMALISQTLAVRFYTEYDGGKFLSYQPGADGTSLYTLCASSSLSDTHRIELSPLFTFPPFFFPW